MPLIPNVQQIKDMAAKLNEEYDLSARLQRYQSLSPELIDMAVAEGLSSKEAASGALFIADFIMTSSEVPSGVSDDDRRKSIIKCFIEGLKQRNTESDNLLRIFYLSQSVAQTMRRNDYFLAGRGLQRAASLVILKDLFVEAYLQVSKEILGDGEPWWELSVLNSALNHTLPHVELDTILGKTKKVLLAEIWVVMREFEKSHKVDVNDTFSISNIENSKVMFFVKPSKRVNTSLWNITKRPDVSENKVINQLLKFMDNSDKDKAITYLRGTVVGSDMSIFMARDPTSPGKPMVLFHTPADEVNVSELLTLLRLKSKEEEGWYQITKKERKLVKHVTKEESVEVEEEIETQEIGGSSIQESKGFFARIKGLFGKNKDSSDQSQKSKTKKEKRIITTKVKKTEKKETVLSNEIPAYVGEALGILSLGALNMFEIFDTLREGEYLIVGTLESDFNNNKTTLLVEDRVGDPQEFAHDLDGLDKVIENVINYFTGSKLQIMLSEILFRIEDKSSFLVCFDGNKDRIVGTIAVSYAKDITKWRENEVEPVKRRTLMMRTGQLLSSRAHTPLDTAIERIYGEALSNNPQRISIDKAILAFDN